MPSHTDPLFDRAAGCLMGQIAGDSLGGLVEFCSPATIRERYPDGPRLLEDGGTWNILAGQPTDDSEMALMLARMLAEAVEYDAEEARRRYLFWLESGPFDMGRTIALGLRGHPDPDSQANGALMRVSPLGIFGATRHWHDVARWAQQDAALTHAHPVCQQANALYACLIAQAIRSGDSPQDLYAWLLRLARRQRLEPCLYEILELAPHEAPADYVHKMGWVRIALHNALWQLLHAPTLEEGVVDTVRRGGDTDTNAAICGALLGAVYGLEAIPAQWRQAILACRPQTGRPGVHHPRPDCFWPVDVPDLVPRLLEDRRDFRWERFCSTEDDLPTLIRKS